MRFAWDAARRLLRPVARRRYAVPLSIVVVAAPLAGYALIGRQPAAQAGPTVATVARGTVSVEVSASGTVVAATTRALSFSTSGTLTEVNVKAGDTVTAGQVLARIDNSAAQAAVSAAQSQLDTATADLASAQQATAAPTPTGGTRTGGVAGSTPTCPPTGSSGNGPGSGGTPRPSPTGSPTRSATAPSPTTTGTAAPARPGGSTSAGPTTAPTGAPTGPAPTRQPTTDRTGTCTPDGRSTGGGGTSGGTGGTGNGGGDTGSGGGGTSGTGSGGGRGGGVYPAQQQYHNAQLALVTAQRQLDGTTITAPVAGKVLSVAGAVGATEAPGSTPFIVLSSVADVAVQARFAERDATRLVTGQDVQITLPGKPGTSYPGRVAQLDPAGTVSGRLVLFGALINFDQPPPGLLYGQRADVSVTVATASGVLYLPSAAVTAGIDDATTGTVRVRTGDAWRTQTIHIGLRGDRFTEITSGLSAGGRVALPGTGGARQAGDR